MKRAIPYVLSGTAYICGIGLIICSAWLITMASFHPPLLTLSMAIVGVRFFGIGRSVARYTERITSHKNVFDQLTSLRVRLFEKITSRPLDLMKDFGSGTLIKRVVDDVERAQEYELRVTLPHAAAIVSLLAGAVLGGWIRPLSLVITLPILFLILVVVPKLVLRKCELIARNIENYESEYVSLIQQAGYGLLEAQLYGYLNERLDRTAEIENRIKGEEMKLARMSQRFQLLFISLVGLSLSLLAILTQSLSPEIPAVQVTMLIFLPLVLFEAVIAWYPNLFGAGKLLLAKSEISAIEDQENLPRPSRRDVNSTHLTLVARDVLVSWGDGKHFMRPISFEIPPGTSLVIRGRSGSGKSTLALGLLGLLEYEGHLFLNGVELRAIDHVSNLMVGALQNGHVFNTTVRENLRIAATDATDADIFHVLEIVELDALVRDMNEGLDTLLGEFGRPLSGGEVKRLNVARALLSPAPVLILDEPTEHLEPALAKRIEQRILDLGRTLLVITHTGWKGANSTFLLER